VDRYVIKSQDEYDKNPTPIAPELGYFYIIYLFFFYFLILVSYLLILILDIIYTNKNNKIK